VLYIADWMLYKPTNRQGATSRLGVVLGFYLGGK